jgi:hypothetical protein
MGHRIRTLVWDRVDWNGLVESEILQIECLKEKKKRKDTLKIKYLDKTDDI